MHTSSIHKPVGKQHYEPFLYNHNDSHTHRMHARALTSGLDFLYAHIDHHGPLGVVGFDQRGQVAAVHLLDVPQVRLTVVGHHFGALLMDIQPAVWRGGKTREALTSLPEENDERGVFLYYIIVSSLQRISSSPTHSTTHTATLFFGTELNLLTF